jgi:hypothetical protein
MASPEGKIRREKPRDPFARDAEEKLSRRLQAKTEVRRARRGGTITIRFGSEEELIRIYDQLMGKK